MNEVKEAVSSNAESPEKQLTAKEKYDAEMKEINKTISTKNAPEKEAGWTDEQIEEHEEEVEAIEEELDKQLPEGTVKHTITQEQFLKRKTEEQRKEILSKFTGAGGLRRDKLSPQDEATMGLILGCVNQGKINDPVLNHLVNKKLDLAKDQAKLNVEIKQVQLEIVQKMGKLVEEAQSGQAAVDAYNRDILLYVQKNPQIIPDKK